MPSAAGAAGASASWHGGRSVSQSTVSRAERGWLEELTLRTIRALFAGLEARVQLAPRWKGAELERLLDEDHSLLVAEVARRLETMGWAVALEVTYSEWGERGSIDVLGRREAERSVVVVEVKTDVASSEAIGRKLDEKSRLAAGIVVRRWGWTPTSIARLLVMPDSTRLRRLVERHEVIGRMFPVDAVAIRRWLRRPAGSMSGLWFLSDTRPVTQRGTAAGRDRRSVPAPRSRPALVRPAMSPGSRPEPHLSRPVNIPGTNGEGPRTTGGTSLPGPAGCRACAPGRRGPAQPPTPLPTRSRRARRATPRSWSRRRPCRSPSSSAGAASGGRGSSPR